MTADEQVFEVPREVALMMPTVKDMLNDIDSGDDIPEAPLPNVTGTIMAKVLEYLAHHLANPDPLPEGAIPLAQMTAEQRDAAAAAEAAEDEKPKKPKKMEPLSA